MIDVRSESPSLKLGQHILDQIFGRTELDPQDPLLLARIEGNIANSHSRRALAKGLGIRGWRELVRGIH